MVENDSNDNEVVQRHLKINNDDEETDIAFDKDISTTSLNKI